MELHRNEADIKLIAPSSASPATCRCRRWPRGRVGGCGTGSGNSAACIGQGYHFSARPADRMGEFMRQQRGA